MSIFEYDEELHMRQERSSSFAEGKAEGRMEGRMEGRAEDRIALILRNRDSFAVDMLAQILDMDVSRVEWILNLADKNPEKDATELVALMR